jgi:uncharacterized protein YdiU (UPF0061 family)
MAELEKYEDIYLKKYYSMMANKLGLDEVRAGDINLIIDFEDALASIKPDMTIFYQLLIELPLNLESEQELVQHFKNSFYKDPARAQIDGFYKVMKAYLHRINTNTCSREESVKQMKESNPRFILRNYLLHQAIEEMERGEEGLFLKLQQAIKEPYSTNFDEFFAKRPDWASKKAGCSMLSCSS